MENLCRLTAEELVMTAERMEAFELCPETHSIFVRWDAHRGRDNPLYCLDGAEHHAGYVDALKQHLPGQRVIDLGAGASADEHRAVLGEQFGVGKYIPVDSRDTQGCLKNDALLYLVPQPDDHAAIMAFGLLNDPIFGSAFGPQGPELQEVREEYASRLCREIYRVTSDLFIGAGLDRFAADALLEAGFDNHGLRFLDPKLHSYWFKFPFMLTKG